jgi:hypothetical protein
MANCYKLFSKFNDNISIPTTKIDKMIVSKDVLRKKIVDYFKKNHPNYKPKFYIQGSYKTKTAIRTKDDTCDLDDGVYFDKNHNDVKPETLQLWVKKAVEGTTNATPSHRSKCITVDYRAGYNIDLPVFIFDKTIHNHPQLAIKNVGFKEDDPKEFVDYFNNLKNPNGQLVRIVKYLKSWCDYKRQKMPSGLVMTVLAMDNYYENSRDDVSLKFTLVAIQNQLNKKFKCIMQTTPFEDLFEEYDETRKSNFLNNLNLFIEDAKKAIDEKNELRASKYWQKHFGNLYFPNGEDKDEVQDESKLNQTIGNAKPYFFG